MARISDRDFIYNMQRKKAWVENGSRVYSEDSTIIITSEDPINNSMVFNSLEFEKPVVFKNLIINGWIEFKRCSFNGVVIFENCEFGSNSEFSNQKNSNIEFENCDFRHFHIQIERSKFGSAFKIIRCHDVENLNIIETNFVNASIQHCIINKIEISKSHFYSELRIENCDIKSHVRKLSNKYGSIIYLKSKFQDSVFFKDHELKDVFTVQECSFFDTVNIDPFSSIINTSRLNLIDNEFKKKISIDYCRIVGEQTFYGGANQISIMSNRFDDGIYINGLIKDSNTEIDKIKLDFSSTFEGFVKISDFDTNNLIITGENYKSNIILNNIGVNVFSISEFANYSTFQIIKCKAKGSNSSFNIIESYLEKFQFTNCKLNSFFKYTFNASNLSMIRSSNTIWFHYSQLLNTLIIPYNTKSKLSKESKKSIDKQNSTVYLQLRDVFRQLKYAMEQQGDRVNALTFKSHEMRAYHSYLKLNEGWFNADRMSLRFGWTNIYGINWYLPLALLIIVTLLFYGIILFDQDPKYFLQGDKLMLSDYFVDFCKSFSTFVKLLNPLVKLDELFENNEYKVTGLSHFIFFLYKIVYSFFVFQIISAFRKFVKN